jgi:UDP-N-acetylmuramate dehydrogenase
VAYSKREGLRGLEGLAGIPGQVGGAIAGNAGSYGTEIKDIVASVTLIDLEGRTLVLGREDIAFGYRSAELPRGSMVLGAELRLARGRPDEVARRIGKWLETKKKTQPLGKRSAGCVFKNPPGDSAGRLIDRAGCKGMRVGAIEVSGLHADFFINTGGGSARDFLRLMDRVAERVRAAFGIELEPEIRIVGRC